MTDVRPGTPTSRSRVNSCPDTAVPTAGNVLDTTPPRKRETRRCDVQPEDLKHLDVVHGILRLLNEPRQSARPIASLIEKFQVLEARVRRAYRAPQWYTDELYGEPDVMTVMVMIGNRGFEAVLLELLEDLTVLKADLTGP